MDTGLVTIDGSQYFFDEKGVMITDDFDANGKHYSFSADGKCTITDANSGSDDADDSSNTNKDGLSDERFCSLRSMSPAEAMISIRAIIRPAEIMGTLRKISV